MEPRVAWLALALEWLENKLTMAQHRYQHGCSIGILCLVRRLLNLHVRTKRKWENGEDFGVRSGPGPMWKLSVAETVAQLLDVCMGPIGQH